MSIVDPSDPPAEPVVLFESVTVEPTVFVFDGQEIRNLGRVVILEGGDDA